MTSDGYYEIADLMAISSVSEGSPNVLLEAMAAGVPVVATAVGGIPEIAKNQEQALLVPPRDPEAMARAIAVLLSDGATAHRLAAAARDLAATKYSPEQRALGLAGLYLKCARKMAVTKRKQDRNSAVKPPGSGELNG